MQGFSVPFYKLERWPFCRRLICRVYYINYEAGFLLASFRIFFSMDASGIRVDIAESSELIQEPNRCIRSGRVLSSVCHLALTDRQESGLMRTTRQEGGLVR